MRVIVTRPAEQAGPLADALRRAGFEPVLCPLIEIEPIDDSPIDVQGYDWVIVTSANGVGELVRRLRGELPRVAAIGSATAEALRAHALRVDFVPGRSTQEGLVAELPRPAGRVLFVGAEDARRLLASELGADFRPVYRTKTLRPDEPPSGDLAIVASPSAARAFAALELGLPVVSIGPQTSASAAAAGLRIAAEAPTQDVEGLVSAVREAAAG
jgi:uroporphyrinogen-III synthase